MLLALPVAYRDADLTVYRVGGEHPEASQRALLIAAHLVWLTMLVLGAAATLRFRRDESR